MFHYDPNLASTDQAEQSALASCLTQNGVLLSVHEALNGKTYVALNGEAIVFKGDKFVSAYGQQLLHNALSHFIVNQGEIVSKSDVLDIMEALQHEKRGVDIESEDEYRPLCDKYPDVLIHVLRACLKEKGVEGVIKTHTGKGFVLENPRAPMRGFIRAQTPFGKLEMFRENGRDMLRLSDGKERLTYLDIDAQNPKKIMRALIEKPNRIVTSATAAIQSDEHDRPMTPNSFKVAICTLRKSFDAAGVPGKEVVETVWGVGVKLNGTKARALHPSY